MNSRVLIGVCLVFCLVAAVLMLFAASSGPGVISAQGPTISADEASRSAGPKSPESMGQGEPDARLPGAPAACGNSPLDCRYYHISSSIFQGRSSSYSYGYSGSGCFAHLNASPDGFMAPVLIPPGSVIKYLRIYFRDTNVADMGVYLRYFDDGIYNLDLVSVSTYGSAAGVRSALSLEITHTVDYYNYSYGIIAFETPDFTDASIQLCGVRLAYIQSPFSALALPLIAR